MLGPSPDWNVGLSAEDLCTAECGWVQKLTKDLLPWDAGTDSGHSYESPNKPTVPQERIRPLTSLDHPQSPFYDPSGGPITALARVLVERIARKGEQCNTVPDTVDDIVADIAQEEIEEGDSTPETCIYSNWSPWSACSSSTCAKGLRMRQRMLKAQLDAGVPCPHTQDFEPCMAPGCSEEEASPCMLSEWISWSPCSATCGMGMRSRERYVKVFPEDGSSCREPTEETEKCVVNDNCSVDCMLSEWTEWSECNKSCGKGHMIRTRMVKLEPQFGGVPCPETVQRKRCKIRKCTRGPRASDRKKAKQDATERRKAKSERESAWATGCKLSPWSSWTDCTRQCGGGVQQRVRPVRKKSKGKCRPMRESRMCNEQPC
ncbi:Spondin-1 [Bagarius yarrelli]|uniref:Spondin-1 n=1 Tax=Bagarius yarrelli TaxID=175774 RepID=A0A556V0Q6_BAGYA|nr:Spondin-1 [Bagarius yarrelli]